MVKIRTERTVSQSRGAHRRAPNCSESFILLQLEFFVNGLILAVGHGCGLSVLAENLSLSVPPRLGI